MILIEKTQIMGLEPTIRGMRNPMNSWAKSDSGPCLTHGPAHCKECPYPEGDCNATEADLDSHLIIGPNDLDLMLRLAKAGSVDGKFRRMIAVYVDITAPLYWWKEFDTYKVGTVANSCSTMHKIHAKEFTLDDFSHENLFDLGCNSWDTVDTNGISCTSIGILGHVITALNTFRKLYIEADSELKKCHFNELGKREGLVQRKKRYWWQMIQLLPSSYNQKRTVMLNYEVLANIYQHRRNHKLDEWRELCRWIEGLPYSEVITCNVAKEGDWAMEEKIFITSWQEAHTIVDDAVKKGDRSVSIYISPDGGMSISVYPWPDEESLRTAYEQGKISYNDYRAKLGLPMIKT